MRYLAILFLIALLLACGTNSAARVTPAAQLTTIATAPAATAGIVSSTDVATPEILATLATDAPAAEPATDAPVPTDEPTDVPAAAPAPILGAAPKGSDCPADHSVKGNIVDRGANKGDKIYHLRGDNGYAQTKPERCFVDVAEAVAAGFRAVK